MLQSLSDEEARVLARTMASAGWRFVIGEIVEIIDRSRKHASDSATCFEEVREDRKVITTLRCLIRDLYVRTGYSPPMEV